MNPLDVERLQPFVDQGDEFRRERRLLDVVVALQQIDGIDRARCDLFPNGGGERFLRLPFCALTPVEIDDGIQRLAESVRAVS